MLTTRAEAADMSAAHADALHADLPREGCPDCEERPLSSYPDFPTLIPDADHVGHYVVIREGSVVQEIDARMAADAFALVTESGDLYIKVGGQ